jgi:hypothetical protein
MALLWGSLLVCFMKDHHSMLKFTYYVQYKKTYLIAVLNNLIIYYVNFKFKHNNSNFILNIQMKSAIYIKDLKMVSIQIKNYISAAWI